ncbi:Fic family protein [Actibacterium lipolyticum]|uniref:Fic/DOC family protein n=1 Tax=Actibacterium lipolyticum TaxID=1524263 RepID=A0A238L7T5_9RHOB|nr:Fic family protein [Actibacterium lipolyticum]SMX51163.1 Fic/DOC family protein [Actibacterium lipolyticum]
MTWNWQTPDWPKWQYDPQALAAQERQFLLNAGQLIGAWSHLAGPEQQATKVEMLTQEAMQTSAIEGEMLDRASVQSSMRRQFGLSADRRAGAAESGIAELLADGFRNWNTPLDAGMLFDWHRMVCRGRGDLADIGAWRSGGDPMQVVSGPYQRPVVHFEAPPADEMPGQMAQFITWFNDAGADGANHIPALTRAGLAHLYFVSVHPFEDGNGRIARALSEKALAQAVGQPSLTALSVQIERTRRAYYDVLETNNKQMDVTPWLIWFGETVLAAQGLSQRMIDHLIFKAHLMEALRDQLNPRQTKALLRMFDAGPDGFTGGMSAANYITITDASPATARRDLAELVTLGALTRTGEKKGTRYWLVTHYRNR